MPVPATAKTDAQLLEVFSSIQGEGMLVGCRQVFIRFAGCNLACRYCDTPFEPQDACRIEDAPGSGVFVGVRNPVSLDLVHDTLCQWLKVLPGAHHSISLTGGEPLVHADALAAWLPSLQKLLPVHLETNGTLPAALEKVLPWLDNVAMDIKLESMTGVPTPWDAHRKFLRAGRKTSLQVKVIAGEETSVSELEKVAGLVAKEAPEVTIILQAYTGDRGIAVSGQKLLDFQGRLAGIHPLVRVIPQTHRFMDIL